MNQGTRQIRLAAPDCKSAMDERGHVGSNPTVPTVQNPVERVSKNGFNPVPGAVVHFVNTLSTTSPHHRRPANPHQVEQLESSPRNPHALLLRRFLSLLNSVEGRAWISTLPLPEQGAYSGVRSSIERVLAVGHLAAIAHPTITRSNQCE